MTFLFESRKRISIVNTRHWGMSKIGLTTHHAMLIVLSVLWLLCGPCSTATLNGLEGNQLKVILDQKMLEGMTNLSAMLLHHPSGQLFLGAKNTILSVDTNRLDKPPRFVTWDAPENAKSTCLWKGKKPMDCHNYIRLLELLEDGRILVCGTYAFAPKCAYLHMSNFTLEKANDGTVQMESGQGKCPFAPDDPFVTVMAGDSLYTAVSSNFMRTDFRIARATGPTEQRVRTEDSSEWLNDPEFVGAASIQEPADNPTGEDDKILFFFTEVAKEYTFYTEVKVARVARICKSDLGGAFVLQKRWTTYLKAQLVCEDKSSRRRYNILTDIFTMEHIAGNSSSTHFYGLFTSQWNPEFTAVCVYSLSDIVKVMAGPFKELNRNGGPQTYPNSIPNPRPGQCFNNAMRAQGYKSSYDLGTDVLEFVRKYPLMRNTVDAAPLLVRTGTRYIKLAVTQTDSEPKGVILHLGTDRGALHQMEVVGQTVTLLQEIPLFTSHEPVNNIKLHKGQALVGSPMSLARIPAEGCTLYPNCELCARAAGKGCVWDATEKACRSTEANGVQGETVEDALRKCAHPEDDCSPATQELRAPMGLRLLLPCWSPRSCRWEHPPHRHTRQHHNDLEVTVTEESLGTYICVCQEVRPGASEPAPCRRAVYELILDDSHTEGPNIVVFYILCFSGGIVIGGIIMSIVIKRKGISKLCRPSNA